MYFIVQCITAHENSSCLWGLFLSYYKMIHLAPLFRLWLEYSCCKLKLGESKNRRVFLPAAHFITREQIRFPGFEPQTIRIISKYAFISSIMYLIPLQCDCGELKVRRGIEMNLCLIPNWRIRSYPCMYVLKDFTNSCSAVSFSSSTAFAH